MNGILKSVLAGGLSAALAACGGGGADGASTTGQLNLGITDAPVDGAVAVWVTIDGMTIKRSSSDSETTVKLNGTDTTNNAITVNLLNLQNGLSKALFADEVTSGDYQWARFHLASAKICLNSSDPLDCQDLGMPSQDELKTSGSFHVPSNGVVNITVDWDLRKSIVEIGNSGTYKLKPVLHLHQDDSVGSISGEVVSPLDTKCAVNDTRAIYVFTGASITPDDIDGIGAEPIASIYVKSDNTFYVGMLDPGTYTLAFTCDAAKDDLSLDDTTADSSTGVNFPGKVEVTVTAGEETQATYIPAAP